jgi:hypothetical protein
MVLPLRVVRFVDHTLTDQQTQRLCRTGRPKWFLRRKFLWASAGVSAVAFGVMPGVGPAVGRIVEAPADRANSDTYTVFSPYKSMA